MMQQVLMLHYPIEPDQCMDWPIWSITDMQWFRCICCLTCSICKPFFFFIDNYAELDDLDNPYLLYSQ